MPPPLSPDSPGANSGQSDTQAAFLAAIQKNTEATQQLQTLLARSPRDQFQYGREPTKSNRSFSFWRTHALTFNGSNQSQVLAISDAIELLVIKFTAYLSSASTTSAGAVFNPFYLTALVSNSDSFPDNATSVFQVAPVIWSQSCPISVDQVTGACLNTVLANYSYRLDLPVNAAKFVKMFLAGYNVSGVRKDPSKITILDPSNNYTSWSPLNVEIYGK